MFGRIHQERQFLDFVFWKVAVIYSVTLLFIYLLTFSILFLWLHMYRVYVSGNLFIFPRLTNFLACTFYSNLLSIFNSMASQLQCIISFHLFQFQHYQFNKVQLFSRIWLCNSMGCSMPGLLVHHQLPGFTQTKIHRVSDAIQPSHLLSSPSPPAFNLSQHQGLFQWLSSSYQVAKVLGFQLQFQSFQWTPRTDL